MPVPRQLLAAFAGALVVACSDATEPDAPATASRAVEITNAPETLHVSTGGLTVSVRVTNAESGATIDTIPVVISTSDPALVVVDSGNRVRAINEGVAWIHASAGGARDSVRVVTLFPRITDFPTDLAQLRLGGGATCGVTGAGIGRCWYTMEAFLYGTDGQSGPITGHTFRKVQAGERYACGFEVDGTLYCWGSNQFGQLGQGTRTLSSSGVPVLAAGGMRFADVSMGTDDAVCGIAAADSVVYCWGKGSEGQTGVGRLVVDTVVHPVAGSLKATQLSLGYFHGCAIGLERDAWCWGLSEQFGPTTDDGTFGSRATVPRRVGMGHEFTAIAAGLVATCALDTRGIPWCWGGEDDDDRVPDEADRARAALTPRMVRGVEGLLSIDANHPGRACGITADGALWCWPFVAAGSEKDDMVATRMMPARTFRLVTGSYYPATWAIATTGEIFTLP